MKKTGLIIIFTVFCAVNYGQVLSYHLDSTETEIKNIYSKVNKSQKEEADKIIAQFPDFWASMSDDEQLAFVEIANKLFKYKLQPIPHLSNFIATYRSVVESNQSLKSMQNFKKSVVYVIERHATQFNNVMKTYANLIDNQVLNTFTGVSWRAEDADVYYFNFDSVPQVVFPKLSLTAGNGKDTMVIKNTSGIFEPLSMNFYGNKGLVDWTKAGWGERVYATFDEYTITLKAPKIVLENVLYYNPDYFLKPQRGVLEDRVMTTAVDEEKATYPRFTAYDKEIVIPDIYAEVDYKGGVHVRGNNFMGQGDAQHQACLTFKRENKPAVLAYAPSFVLKDNQISSSMCKIVLFLGEDSITHSAIELKYTPKNREMWLIRGQDGPMRMPFLNTYHNIDMYAEALHWKLNEENIEFCSMPGPVSATTAVFESINYFTSDRLNRFLGMNDINPMYTLYEFYRRNHVKSGSIDEITAFFKYGREDVQSLIFQLVQFGFVDFDIATRQVLYREKLGNYLFNEVKKKDYDVLQFRSEVTGNKSNATLSMLNYDLLINGIELLIVSDSQIVNVFPKGKKITMQKNRDFLFHGKVEAGLFDFWVSNCKFNYEPFTMDFTVIDSIVFYVEDKSKGENAMGEYPLEKVRSYISDISGTLYIDQANNKSGTLPIPGYPYFESKSPGRVYYDHDFVYNRAYDRERFYFQVDRFVIRDLDDFDTDSLLFDGYLHSGGIFPDIEKPLKVRPDFSLGFIYHTGESGMPAYQNKAVFNGKIDLSNLGLRCSGAIDYTQAHGEGKNIVFFLDSAIGRLDDFRVDALLAGAEYPPVTGKNDSLYWLPYQDKMKVYSTNYKFRMYDRAKHDGELVVSNTGVTGAGTFLYDIATMRSQNYEFAHHEMFAKSLDIDLYDSILEDYHIRAYDHKGHMDFENEKGDFVANGHAQALLFPINMFKTYSKAFEWKVKEKQLIFQYDDPYAIADIPNTPIKELYAMQSHGNELISTHPAQKELQFTATKATYNFAKYEIHAEGVRYIEIADAAVFPKDGLVDIYRRAEIAPLSDSKILANLDNQYHEIFRANTMLESRESYRADGYYNYVDAQEKIQEIYFDSIWVSRDKQSRGAGKIAEEAGFTLNPHFGYSGSVTLKAENEFLLMRGAVSLLYSCDTNMYAPIRFSGAVNPDSVLIPIGEHTRDTNNRPVVAAIASNASGQIYPAFARAKDAINNPEYIRAYGFLTYNEELGMYVVASQEKLEDLSLPGNVVYMDNKNCIAKGEGRLDLGTNFGRMEFVPMGIITNYIEQDSAEIEVSASMDFYFNEECMKILSNQMESSQNLEPVDVVESKSYQTALLEILGEKEYDKAHTELMQYYHFRRLPKVLQMSFVFADMKMVWKQENKAFVSVGDIGVAICGKKEVNKFVPGIMEIQKKSTNSKSNNKTSMQLYFEFDDQWFYFNYSGTTMQALSSDKTFNELIKNTSQKKKILKADAKNNLAPYRYTIAGLGTKKKFLTKYEFNVEEP
ncbi:MAG: hypothetical protein J5701_04880 [Bacteroidales bacterium]|nr:hypothetical protein [Bacteroidales bacterium]